MSRKIHRLQRVKNTWPAETDMSQCDTYPAHVNFVETPFNHNTTAQNSQHEFPDHKKILTIESSGILAVGHYRETLK
jgi:hypothetical protein